MAKRIEINQALIHTYIYLVVHPFIVGLELHMGFVDKSVSESVFTIRIQRFIV